jgi:hypothetical protein
MKRQGRNPDQSEQVLPLQGVRDEDYPALPPCRGGRDK